MRLPCGHECILVSCVILLHRTNWLCHHGMLLISDLFLFLSFSLYCSSMPLLVRKKIGRIHNSGPKKFLLSKWQMHEKQSKRVWPSITLPPKKIVGRNFKPCVPVSRRTIGNGPNVLFRKRLWKSVLQRMPCNSGLSHYNSWNDSDHWIERMDVLERWRHCTNAIGDICSGLLYSTSFPGIHLNRVGSTVATLSFVAIELTRARPEPYVCCSDQLVRFGLDVVPVLSLAQSLLQYILMFCGDSRGTGS